MSTEIPSNYEKVWIQNEGEIEDYILEQASALQNNFLREWVTFEREVKDFARFS